MYTMFRNLCKTNPRNKTAIMETIIVFDKSNKFSSIFRVYVFFSLYRVYFNNRTTDS